MFRSNQILENYRIHLGYANYIECVFKIAEYKFNLVISRV